MAAGVAHGLKNCPLLPVKPFARAATTYVPGPLSSGTPTVRVVESGDSGVGVPGNDPSGFAATLTPTKASVARPPGLRSIGSGIVWVTKEPGLRVSCGVGGDVIAVDAVMLNGSACVPATAEQVAPYVVTVTVYVPL